MPECDTCNNYEWDEDTQEYFCAADMDEDDYGRLMQASQRMPVLAVG